MSTRYLILAEGFSDDRHYGKTLRGVLRYRREDVAAILDSTRAGETEDGVPVVGTVGEALPLGPTTALVGVATQGGRFPPAWIELLRACIASGLDIENGLHVFLGDDPELRELAARHGVELRDVRRPPPDVSTATGANLAVDATIVLTVGSDCAIGKMSVALELDREARRRGLPSVFVPTGQTGIAIAGWGISIDAVVADFVAGAAERLVLEGAGGGPHRIPPLGELVELHERLALPARPARVAAIALNTRRLDEAGAREAIAAAEGETGLPADDPVRFGAGRLVEAVLAARY